MPLQAWNPPPVLDERNPPTGAANAAELRRQSSFYKNRVCVPLSRDAFMEITRHHLEAHGIHYARVPFRSRDEVHYFFNSVADVAILLQVVPYRLP
jgi:hypothetical protein